MLRKVLAGRTQGKNPIFRNRGHEIQRIETFSDAVFAFALTLLIVSLEVPKSFDELLITMRGFFAFGISFVLLAFIWHEQNIFFRRYGLDDTRAVVLNLALDFVILFYVYPLKFLFTMIFSDQIYGPGHSPFTITPAQSPALMMIYGIGFIVIYLLFLLMYLHALGKKDVLQLTKEEVYDTRTKLYSKYIFIGTGIVSLLMIAFVPADQAGSAGIIYFLLFPCLTFFYTFRGRMRRRTFPAAIPENEI